LKKKDIEAGEWEVNGRRKSIINLWWKPEEEENPTREEEVMEDVKAESEWEADETDSARTT